MLNRLRTFFAITEKGSSIQIEVLAGLSTFLSLSYIFVVNPAILSQAGMNKSFVFFATIMASALATIAMGLWPRLPFVLAPGMELNAYVAFFVVGSLGFTWKQALGAVFWSGVAFVILTLLRVREKVIEAIPERMRSALSLSVGVFLCLVALKVAGLLIYENVTIKGLGSFTSPVAYAFYVSLSVILILEWLHIRGAVLIGIIVTAVVCHFLGVSNSGEAPAKMSLAMFSGIGQLDLGVIANPRMFSVILILFLIDFYGSIAKFIGLSINTNLVVGGKLPRLRDALLIDGAATTLGSALGTSSIIVYVESAVGIGAGGRTGLTAVVCGLLMLSCFILTPFLGLVPVVATTGALVFVGLKLCPTIRDLKSYSWIDLIVLITMPLTVIATFAIDRAMLAGFAIYLVGDLLARRRLNPYLIGSLMLLAIGAVLQMRS
ncbi:MAG: adenine/guanine/hypoxanthine permease [Blastocatellia bacterium]|jgi:AGZA family xanthine/uracil permease-like MFS transporter|nr:adenine/guanine/hypoxanthine permease [Blastocatellia bacterium]